jgi:hypothetical protein
MKKLNLQLIQKVFLISCLLLIIRSGATGQSSAIDRSSLAPDKNNLKAPIWEADATRFEPIKNIDTGRSLANRQSLIPLANSGLKSTGFFYVADNTERVVEDDHFTIYVLSTTEEIPPYAEVTNVEYRIKIDDNDWEEAFFPCDYEIYIGSESQEICVYDNLGGIGSHTDDGHDDDEEDDSDIFLNFRPTHSFDGEEADQYYSVRVLDNMHGGYGKVCYVSLKITWEAPDLPNLDAEYTPSGWDDPLVVNHTADSYANAAILYANTTTYLNTCFADRDYSASDAFFFNILVDGTTIELYDYAETNANWYYHKDNIEHTFTAGEHTVCQKVDPLNSVTESDEEDNEYCRTLSWIGAPAAPSLSSPSDGATDQSGSLTLSWNSSTNATGYNLQVDNNPDFSSAAVDQSVSGTSQEVSGLSDNKTFYWRVCASNPAGTGAWSNVWEFTTEGNPNALTNTESTGYYLGQNYPNPFTGTTTIEFSLPAGNQVSIEIMDLQGKLIESYTGYYAAGIHTLVIDMNGKVQSGVYFYRMTTNDFIDTKIFIFR